MEFPYDAIPWVASVLRRRTRETIALSAALVLLAPIRYPTAPVLAPSRWFACGWYVHTVEAQQAVMDPVVARISPDAVPDHPEVLGPEPWC